MNAAQPTSIDASETTIDSRYYLAPTAGAGWLAGIWLGSIIDLSVAQWLCLSLPLIFGTGLFWRRGRAGLVLAALVVCVWGGARYKAAQPAYDPDQLHYYNGSDGVIAEGVVISEPEESDTQATLRVEIEELVIDNRSHLLSGILLVQTERYPPLAYGASLRLEGDIDEPDQLGSSSYATYLERQGVLSVMEYPRIDVLNEGGGSALMGGLLRIKARGREVIAAILPEPHAALLNGILLGDDSGMPRALKEDFRQIGMTHIIAISGFNIAVLVALLDQLTGPIFPRRMAAIVIMLILGLYAILVGAGASVVRATIMGITYLTGLRLMGRPTLVVAGLFCASFLMTLVHPGALWDIGFQLSFAATLGLMLFARPWTRRLDRGASAYLAPEARHRVMRLMIEVVIVTLAAQLLTLPLILYHFGRLSLASLPANILVLPVQPAVMMSGAVALLLGYMLPVLGHAAGLVAWLFLDYTITIIRLLAEIPGASLPIRLSSWGLVMVYTVIAAIVFLVTADIEFKSAMSRAVRSRFVSKVLIVGLVVVSLLGISWLSNRADGRLHVAFLDVGQGDAIFIQTPAGRQVLIDGGRYPSTTLDQLGRQMPFWDRTIDIVIATHPDIDHVAGLVSVMERYQISRLITNGAGGESDPAFNALLLAAEEQGSPVHPARIGDTILLDDGVRLEILHTGSGEFGAENNETSIVSRLTYGTLSVLLTGDAEAEAEQALIRSGRTLNAIVLKAGHHGANTSSGELFLQTVSPQIVIISAGRDNSYGHPHPAMLERVKAAGATILRTDLSGTLEVESDGRYMWWEAENASGEEPLPSSIDR